LSSKALHLQKNSFSWKSSIINLPEDFAVHMGIYLGGGNITVPQEFLHNPEIRPVLQKMGSKGVPKGMRSNILFDPCFTSVPLYQGPDVLAG
jgi:hypothetical protein